MLTASQAHRHAYDATPPRAIGLAGEARRVREPLLLSVAPDNGPGAPDLPALWSSLVSGALRILAFSRSGQHYRLELEEVRPGCRLQTPSRLDVETLERTLLGEAQKVIAIDFGCSPSTIAARTSRCLKALGLGCTTAAVPASVIMLLRAAREQLTTIHGDVIRLVGAGRSVLSVSIRRPEAKFGGRLSAAEREVVLMMADGQSHLEIARSRCASLRTVANQIASAYRKLGVSGRFELIGWWLNG